MRIIDYCRRGEAPVWSCPWWSVRGPRPETRACTVRLAYRCCRPGRGGTSRGTPWSRHGWWAATILRPSPSRRPSSAPRPAAAAARRPATRSDSGSPSSATPPWPPAAPGWPAEIRSDWRRRDGSWQSPARSSPSTVKSDNFVTQPL